MQVDRASWTALGAASNRAMHLFVDDPPPILHDEWARRFIGADAERAYRASAAAFRTREWGALRALAVVRNRWAEDLLERAIDRGVGQYVMLGAGLDSFAHRAPRVAERIAVFEVDHPASQRAKRAMLAELGAPDVASLHYVPVDFESQMLAEELPRAGFRPDRPAFFAWLGVTIYLTDAAIVSTLDFVRRCAPGTEIVFEYALPSDALPPEERAMLAASIARCEARGERFESFFTPAALVDRLAAMRFAGVRDFGPREADAAYLAGRSDSLWFSDLCHLMHATVEQPT
jgi:methyltransferase (TIGR00027 family)